MEIKGKKINFLGDSITEGVGVSDESKLYWRLLGERDGAIVKGYGISGSRIARQQVLGENLRMERYFYQRANEDMDNEADIVVIFGGTNDYGHGDAAFGKMSDRTLDTFYGAYHMLCQLLIEKYPKAQIVIMTPCHRLDENKDYNELGIRNVNSLSGYVNAIKEVASYYAIPVLDLYSLSNFQPEIEVNRNLYMPDGLHLSDEGHEIIYSRLKEFLKNL